VLAGALMLPSPIAAWSFDLHRYVTARAIEQLPTAIRPFFRKHRGFIVEHSVDPDLWRSAGFVEEPPNHFLDIDSYGEYPFVELPRDFDAAIAKYGKERIEQEGKVPWRVAEMFDLLVKAFEQQASPESGYALENVKFYSAVLSHYVGDAHQPFHAVKNYNGQLTNQHGIHSRFEGELFRRYESRLTIAPPPLEPVPNARDYVFDVLLESYTLVDPLLRADRAAVEGKTEYDDDYFRRFMARAQPILERRVSEAIAGVASVIVSAWEKGGKPDLPLNPVRQNRKVRRSDP
jgi:hypothetical protein